MAETYLPSREADLDAWAASFDSQIAVTPTDFGLTAAQATAFTTLFTTWHTAWVLTTDNRSRTPQAIQEKNDAKAAMVGGPGGIRELVAIIQAFPGTTNGMRVALNITVPDSEPSPVGPPETAPNLSVASVIGRIIKVRLRDQENPDRRGKPDGVTGATILYYIGETAPDDVTEWSLYGQESRTLFDVTLPVTVPPGSKVWLTAYWYNIKGDSGPASAKVNTFIAEQPAQAA